MESDRMARDSGNAGVNFSSKYHLKCLSEMIGRTQLWLFALSPRTQHPSPLFPGQAQCCSTYWWHCLGLAACMTLCLHKFGTSPCSPANRTVPICRWSPQWPICIFLPRSPRALHWIFDQVTFMPNSVPTTSALTVFGELGAIFVVSLLTVSCAILTRSGQEYS